MSFLYLKLASIIRSLLVVIFLVSSIYVSLAQTLTTTSKKAIRLYHEGRNHFALLEYEQAELKLKKAIGTDKNFLEAYMLLGDIYRTQNKNIYAVETYKTAIEINPDKYPEVFYFYGILCFEMQQYQLCIEQLEQFKNYNIINEARQREADYYLASARFAQRSLKNPVPFQPINLGTNINSANDEFINAVSTDELKIYITAEEAVQGLVGVSDRFFISYRDDLNSAWQPIALLPPPLNSEDTQGALSLTHDGRYLLFAGCQWSDGYGSCDIYAVKTVGKNIGKPQNLGHTLNSTAWDSQPCLAPDGRTLYFSSTRKGGYGKSDIWRSYLQDNGEWSTPENLGETINTYGSEMSPYIHADGKTLYFSSDRHPGMGGMDLFVAKMDSAGNWEKPVNLGYPINTSGDEINIIVNARGDKAYISARLPEGNGGFDIYEFEVYPEIRPKPSTYVKGIVVDAKTNNPLLSYFTLTEINAGKDIITSFSDEKTGEFLLCLPINRDYALNVSREGYLFHSEHFSLTDYKEVFEPYLLNIALNPIIPGEVTIMRNIFFDSGKANLKDESLAELNKLYEFLIQNPSIAVEISGHTDDVGSEDYNMTLSDQRAQAVTDFLVAKGIDSNRLQHKGYGFTKPLTTNQTQEGRAKNRRTEIKVIEMPK